MHGTFSSLGTFAYGGDYYDEAAVDIDPKPHRVGTWRFSPGYFAGLLSTFEVAISRSCHRTWRFSGGADLVSLMVYGAEPDWLSLRSVDLMNGAGTEAGYPIGKVIEGLRRWETEEPDHRFAAGLSPYDRHYPAARLSDALRWSALATAGGVLGNRVDALLGALLR